jgi:hypothetical protein
VFQLCPGCGYGVGIILGASLLHVAQASVDIDEVLLHLVHVLGGVGIEGLEPRLHLH